MKKTSFMFLAIMLACILVSNTIPVFALPNELTISVADESGVPVASDTVAAEDIIHIKGTANPQEQLVVTILNSDGDLSAASDSNIGELIYYVTDTYADNSAEWDITYSFSSCPTGEYKIIVNSEDTSRKTSLTLTVINEAERNATLNAINNASDADDIADVFINSDGGRNLMFDTSAFNRLSVSASYIDLVFQKFFEESSGETVTLSNLGKYKSIFEQNSALALFNEKKSASVLTEYSQIFDFSSVTGVSQTIIYIPDDTQKYACLSALEGKQYTSVAALRSDYGAVVCMHAVKYAPWTSFDRIITLNTSHFASLDMATYNLLNSKSGIATYMKQKSYTVKSDFVSGFNQKVTEAYEAQLSPPSGGGTSTGGTSSGGGSSISGGAYVPPEVEQDNSFFDIDSVPWAVDAIEYLRSKGVISGITPNTFEPDRAVTREEFVKMLVVLIGKYNPLNFATFSDVPSSHWSSAYIASASDAGIIKGIDADKFGLGLSITRQDACVIIARAISDISKGNISKTFTDSADISDYAKDAVEFMASVGVVNGTDDGSFKPFDSLTRAQTAKILYELIMIMEG